MLHVDIVNTESAPKFPYTDAQVEDLLNGIYDETYTPRELPEDLYRTTADYLKKAIYKGFGGNLSDFANTPDFELLNELRTNIYMFGAAKTYQQTKELSSLLVDGDRVRTQAEFNKLGRRTFNTWNDDWGASEYKTAVASASMANKWGDIERSKDILPVLSYSTIGDACDICKPLDGLTLPVDSPKWDTIYPPNHFNCFCLVTQHEEGEKKLTPTAEANKTFEFSTDHMSDVFKMNSGMDKYIFSPEHPYFQVDKKDRAFAAENFGLPIPKTDKK